LAEVINYIATIFKKNCGLSTTSNGEMTRRQQQKMDVGITLAAPC